MEKLVITISSLSLIHASYTAGYGVLYELQQDQHPIILEITYGKE